MAQPSEQCDTTNTRKPLAAEHSEQCEKKSKDKPVTTELRQPIKRPFTEEIGSRERSSCGTIAI